MSKDDLATLVEGNDKNKDTGKTFSDVPSLGDIKTATSGINTWVPEAWSALQASYSNEGIRGPGGKSLQSRSVLVGHSASFKICSSHGATAFRLVTEEAVDSRIHLQICDCRCKHQGCAA
ncbi:MAG: hypothetical protein Q9205_005856 [Flavoplaca limonia]